MIFFGVGEEEEDFVYQPSMPSSRELVEVLVSK
jgi:hypothetical protein